MVHYTSTRQISKKNVCKVSYGVSIFVKYTSMRFVSLYSIFHFFACCMALTVCFLIVTRVGSVSTSWASTSDGWTTFSSRDDTSRSVLAWHCASVQPVERVSSCVSMKMKGQTLCLVLNESRKVYLGVWFSVLASLCRSHTFTKIHARGDNEIH